AGYPSRWWRSPAAQSTTGYSAISDRVHASIGSTGTATGSPFITSPTESTGAGASHDVDSTATDISPAAPGSSHTSGSIPGEMIGLSPKPASHHSAPVLVTRSTSPPS